MENRATIKIPRELYRKLSQIVTHTGFSSVNELIVFVMRTLASDEEIKSEDRLTIAEVRAIRKRLEKLGYIEGGE